MSGSIDRMLHRELAFDADGSSLTGHYFVDGAATGPRPGVVVFDEATGLSEHAIATARRLAQLGFTALAADYCEAGRPSEERIAYWIARLSADPAAARVRATAGLEVLVRQPETDAATVSAWGYCLGGTIALELARSGAMLHATIGVHCGLRTTAPARVGNLHGKMLVALGTADPFVGADDRAAFADEMDRAGANWSMLLFGGVGHSFTNPAVDAYGRAGVAFEPRAADDAWHMACRLLA